MMNELKGMYLPSFKYGKEIIIFPWVELAGTTLSEAIEKLNPWGWDRTPRLWVMITTLKGIEPTGDFHYVGKQDKPWTYYQGKIDGYEVWLIGGEVFKYKEKQNEEDKPV